jgi:hypothetical protein
MLRPLLLGTCLAVALTGCLVGPQTGATKAANTAMTGACLAAHLYPCTPEPTAPEKSKDAEKQAAAVQAGAQRNSAAADQDSARRSSCLTDTGPTLPVSSDQCATYGATGSRHKR